MSRSHFRGIWLRSICVELHSLSPRFYRDRLTPTHDLVVGQVVPSSLLLQSRPVPVLVVCVARMCIRHSSLHEHVRCIHSICTRDVLSLSARKYTALEARKDPSRSARVRGLVRALFSPHPTYLSSPHLSLSTRPHAHLRTRPWLTPSLGPLG